MLCDQEQKNTLLGSPRTCTNCAIISAMSIGFEAASWISFLKFLSIVERFFNGRNDVVNAQIYLRNE